MPTFTYKARSNKGKLAEGDIEADSKQEAAGKLMAQGFMPSSLVEKKETFNLNKILNLEELFEKVTTEEIILFTSQMTTLFKAGIPLVATFDALIEQAEKKKFKRILKEIKAKIEEGSSLNQSMSDYPEVFSETYVSIVAAGEQSGMLGDSLEKLIGIMEMQYETKNKISEVTRYPKIIAGSVTAAVSVLMIFVVPKFIVIFEKAKLELPLPTKILIALNYLFSNYWYVGLGGAIGAYVLFNKYIATEKGRYHWHHLILRMPIIGDIMLKITFAQFCSILANMVKSGISIVQSIETAGRAAGNDFLMKIFRDVVDSVKEGSGVAAPLKAHGIVPPIVIQMISAGESSGALDEMLIKVSDYFKQEANRKINMLASLIEPIMLFVLGGIVLFIALAIFLPMWDMTKMAG